MGHRHTTLSSRRYRMPRQGGFSLLETLFAAVLLFIVSVSILPLFTRALQSNTAGGWSSVMSNFVSEGIEEENQMILDHEDFDLPVGSSALDLGTQYWNSGAADDGDTNRTLGDGKWQATPDGPGLVLWMRRAKVRKYSFADIGQGTINADGTATLVTRGHPQLFDSPLDNDDGADGYKAHLTELRVTVQPCRNCDGSEPEQFLNLGQRMTVSQFRAY